MEGGKSYSQPSQSAPIGFIKFCTEAGNNFSAESENLCKKLCNNINQIHETTPREKKLIEF